MPEAAGKKEPSYADFLLEVVSAEADGRKQRYLKTRLQLAHLRYLKTFDQFDFAFQPSIDERQIRELRTLRFVHEASNMILPGPPAVGNRQIHSAGEAILRSGDRYVDSRDKGRLQTRTCATENFERFFEFLRQDGVGPTNKAAEGALRRAVQWWKISFASRKHRLRRSLWPANFLLVAPAACGIDRGFAHLSCCVYADPSLRDSVYRQTRANLEPRFQTAYSGVPHGICRDEQNVFGSQLQVGTAARKHFS